MREENFINEENRFCSSLNNFDFLDENPAAYLEEKEKSMITYEEKCAIGDVVVLKKTELHVRITDVDYKTAAGLVFDYAGYNIFESDKRKYLFLQRDIKSVVPQRHR